jgi:hypothetical protein
MAASTKISILSLSAILLHCTLVPQALAQAPSPSPQPATQVNSLKEVFERLFTCWKPPAASVATPMDITVLVSFNRSGAIMGRPRITYESPKATDSDRLAYRVAVMEALQRCSPMPFTETMAGATAGRPLAIQFRTHFQHQEKRAWLSPKIL